MLSKRNRVHESDSEKEEKETDKQQNDNRQFQPGAPLIHRITGNGRVLQPKTIPWGRQTPSTSWLKVQNTRSDH